MNQIETVYKIVAQGGNGLFTSVNINSWAWERIQTGVLPVTYNEQILQYKLRHQTLPKNLAQNALFVCKKLAEARILALKNYVGWADVAIFQGYGCNVRPFHMRDKKFVDPIDIPTDVARYTYFSDWFIPMKKVFFAQKTK